MPPGTRNALVPPSPNYLQNAGQFVGGVGRSLLKTNVTGPLELVQQSYYDPYALGQGVVQGVAQFAQDPVGAVGNSLRSMWNRAKSSPAGLGEVVGENIDPRNWLKPRKVLRHELDVYHGTPHTFDPETGAPLGRFRSSKIGTGEGAQAYGYGLYFAEDQKTAKGYAATLANRDATNQGRLNAHANAQRLANLAGDPAFAADDIKYALEINPDHPQKTLLTDTLKFLETGDYKKPLSETGRVYTVDLPDAKIEQMLDWDKPLSEQSENVRNALKRRITDVQPIDKFDMGGGSRLRDNRTGQYDKTKPYPWILEANSGNGTSAFGLTQKDVDRMFGGKDASSLTGEQIISRLAVTQGSQAAASKYLRSLGIPGIKYLDAGSRDGGKGTRNFVVFPGEEQHLNILSRD